MNMCDRLPLDFAELIVIFRTVAVSTTSHCKAKGIGRQYVGGLPTNGKVALQTRKQQEGFSNPQEEMNSASLQLVVCKP